MRVLLALDGTTASVVARRLVSDLPWPPDTLVRVACVVAPPSELVLASTFYVAESGCAAAADAAGTRASAVVDTTVEDLGAREIAVDGCVLHGSVAPSITTEARDWHADLIVVGTRGYGPIRGLLLGSVSAAVIDEAPCPVLVARSPTIDKVVIGVDGSAAAREATSLIGRWPVFRSLPMEVVAVGPEPEPPLLGLVRHHAYAVAGAYGSSAIGQAVTPEAAAAVAVNQLRACAIHATASVSHGHAMHDIVDAVRGEKDDLIVIGSRGTRGLARWWLGGTARGVLHAASASVLVVPVGDADG